jgi:hypothetical protein
MYDISRVLAKRRSPYTDVSYDALHVMMPCDFLLAEPEESGGIVIENIALIFVI